MIPRGPHFLAPLALGALTLLGCPTTAAETREAGTEPSCGVLFGRPEANTGLTEAQCQPRCTCGSEPFEAPLYTDADVKALAAFTLLDPPALLTADPYAAPAPPAPTNEQVCAVLPDAPGARAYRLRDYPTVAAAKAAGATPTHYGTCGLCSSLANLAVYMRYPDLTTPVRACGLKGGGKDAQQRCLEALGFEPACAQIWSFNTDHTRTKCLPKCLATLTDPYHLPDGSLNECLACDETESGPVFKAVAGRTRRNTGIASALCRPCSEARPLVHRY